VCGLSSSIVGKKNNAQAQTEFLFSFCALSKAKGMVIKMIKLILNNAN